MTVQKHANPAGALSRRLIESVHHAYIDELQMATFWSKDSIVEMLLLVDGNVDELKALYNDWNESENQSSFGRLHDAMRSFLGLLHRERDRKIHAATELRRKLIRSNFAQRIAEAEIELGWSASDIVEAIDVSGGDFVSFETAYGIWSSTNHVDVGASASARIFIKFARQRQIEVATRLYQK